MTPRMRAALAWAARGFRVFPLIEGTKFPAIKDYAHAATLDPLTIMGWWGERDYNIGCVPDHVCIVDLDVKDGRDGITHWMEAGGGFDTLTVHTPSGGYHLYYLSSPTANTVDKLGLGIDTRGPTGYVAAPGSTFNGADYCIEIDAPLAPLPAPFALKLSAPRERAASTEIAITALDSPSAVASAIDYAVHADPAIEGMGGDNHTFNVAAELRDRGVSAANAYAILLEHFNPRCLPPWEPGDLWAKVTNAYSYAQNAAGSKAPEAFHNGVVLDQPQYVQTPTVAETLQFGNLPPLIELRERPWLLRRMLLRKEITALIAPGGTGKSQFALTVAMMLALGVEDVFGFRNMMAGTPVRSVVYNAEDDMNEMAMRVYATCTAYNIDPERVRPYIALASGKGNHVKLRFTEGARGSLQVAEDSVRNLADFVRGYGVGMLALDPLSKLHGGNENDNGEMSAVMSIIDQLAFEAECAILLSHHTGKEGLNASRYAGSGDAARGAAAIRDSVRVALTLMSPSDDDVAKYGMMPADRARYLRLDDAKTNRGLLGTEPLWLRKETIRLHTGEEVGAFQVADPRGNAAIVNRRMADTLIAEIRATGQATMLITQAVALLRAADPLYAQMETAQVRQRMENVLVGIVEGSDGSTLKIVSERGRRLVVLD